jgi:DNA-binding NarL/FixJ family response regulator
MRAGVRAILEREPGIQVVGEASAGGETVAVAHHVQPAIVIMDIAEPRAKVIEAIRVLSGRSTEPTRVVTFAATDNEVAEAIRAGARGLLLKGCSAEELVRATRAVAAGEGFITPRIAGRLLGYLASRLPLGVAPAPVAVRRLTPRELEILRLIAWGQSNAEIAEALSVCEATVRSHVHHLLARLELRDHTHAVAFAYQSGLVHPDRAEPISLLDSARQPSTWGGVEERPASRVEPEVHNR